MTKSQYVKDRRKKFNSCASCFKRFDDLIMRPLLIFNYEHELLNKKEEFLEMFMKEGDMWEKLYLQEQYDPEEIQEVRTQRGNSVFRHIENISRKNSLQRINIRNSGLSISSKTGPISALGAPRSPGLAHRVVSPQRELRSNSHQLKNRP